MRLDFGCVGSESRGKTQRVAFSLRSVGVGGSDRNIFSKKPVTPPRRLSVEHVARLTRSPRRIAAYHKAEDRSSPSMAPAVARGGTENAGSESAFLINRFRLAARTTQHFPSPNGSSPSRVGRMNNVVQIMERGTASTILLFWFDACGPRPKRAQGRRCV